MVHSIGRQGPTSNLRAVNRGPSPYVFVSFGRFGLSSFSSLGVPPCVRRARTAGHRLGAKKKVYHGGERERGEPRPWFPWDRRIIARLRNRRTLSTPRYERAYRSIYVSRIITSCLRSCLQRILLAHVRTCFRRVHSCIETSRQNVRGKYINLKEGK